MYQEDLSWGLFCSISLFHVLDKELYMFIKYCPSPGAHVLRCAVGAGDAKRVEGKCLSFLLPERQKPSETTKVTNKKILPFVENNLQMK